MSWDQIAQLLRIVLYTIGGVVFGDAVADGAMYQGVIGGVINLSAFAWWFFFGRQATDTAAKEELKAEVKAEVRAGTPAADVVRRL